MYNSCASKTVSPVGSACAAVIWAQSAEFQLKNVRVTNTLSSSVGSGTHQALALRADGDRTQLDTVRLISFQDTLYLSSSDATTIARASVRNSYIEGDTDFVYGRASAVFDADEFHLVSTRKPSNGVIFAPSTAAAWPYGFLVTNSRITADAGYATAPTGHLGRAWDTGAGTTGYLPGTTPNGQLVIRDSTIGLGFDLAAPWAAAATTARPFAGNIASGRDLNDLAFNRLWEVSDVSVSTSGRDRHTVTSTR
jgi:pectinesterase